MSGAGDASAPLVADPWLGGILGRPAFRLAAPLVSPQALAAPVFVTAKVDAARMEQAVALQDIGFRVVDTALTFDAVHLDVPAPDSRVRLARSDDETMVRDVAGRAFTFTRFHLDPAMPKVLADRVKAEWAGNFFAGRRGDGMVVAEQDGRVVGFLQLLWDKTGRLVIDLIGVAPEAAGQGLGRAMIGLAQAQGCGDGRLPTGFVVGTQAANVPACRFYQRMGFVLCAAAQVLHHHGSTPIAQSLAETAS